MASSRILISSQTLGSSAASVTFSSIPSTYTDLVVKASVRSSANSNGPSMGLVLNNNTTAIYSFTRLQGNGSAGTASSQFSGQNAGDVSYANGSLTDANTFNNMEIYIPSYTASQNKPISSITMVERNNTIAYINAVANLFSSTAAISSVQITESSGNNFVTGSSFYLYGIKNS